MEAQSEESGTIEDADPASLVLKAWRDALAAEEMDFRDDDDFFEAGGDSLGALIVVQILSEDFGATLPLTFVFDHRTMSEQVQYLVGLKGREAGQP